MNPHVIKGMIDKGDFWIQGTRYALSKKMDIYRLSKIENNKSILVLKIYPEENLYRTVLKFTGFNLSVFAKHKEEKQKKQDDKEKEKDLKQRQKEIFEKLQEVDVTRVDILCFLRRSEHTIDERDIKKLEEAYSKIKNDNIPKSKIFPISNRTMKNYYFNIKKMYPGTKALDNALFLPPVDLSDSFIRIGLISFLVIVLVLPFIEVFIYAYLFLWN